MNEDFVTFELAKKLKEKGFNCELPFAMYNEIGQFCLLTTSAPYHVCESGYKCREYYDYNDFDKYDFIAPTISQVLKWLRKEHKLHIDIAIWDGKYIAMIVYIDIKDKEIVHSNKTMCMEDNDKYDSYEQAALAGIEYVIDNLI